ncbi:MAG: alpha/beta fold hydrolase [Pyrinomonadaceae bacterium]
MSKEIIHFAHANGFPAKTYRKLFAYLEKDFEINYLARHAHNPKFPVTDGWERLRDELRDELEKRYTQKIIGIGHSLGGILHLLAAVENPELYKQIILLDAPVISRLTSRGIRILKAAKLLDRFTPANVTRFRRNRWQTREEVFEYFKSKPKFQAFDEDVLRDYAEHATIKNENGFELFFKPAVEARIFQTLPHQLPKLKGKLKVPTSYIGGTHSREGRLARLSFMKRNFPADFYKIEGSHFFPFENPAETAQIIKNIIARMPDFKA